MKKFDFDLNKIYGSQKLSIGVFCSSSEFLEPIYKESAYILGELIAKNSYDLVHGGGKIGLMGILAKAVQLNGGKVIGILPESLNIKGIVSEIDDEIIITKDMTDRKNEIRKRSSAFIVLPGGFGTMEEFFETITLIQLQYINKPLVLININNYYDNLIKFIQTAVNNKFIPEKDLNLFYITNNCYDAINFINNKLKNLRL